MNMAKVHDIFSCLPVVCMSRKYLSKNKRIVHFNFLFSKSLSAHAGWLQFMEMCLLRRYFRSNLPSLFLCKWRDTGWMKTAWTVRPYVYSGDWTNFNKDFVLFLCLYRAFWLINVYYYTNRCTCKYYKINITIILYIFYHFNNSQRKLAQIVSFLRMV